MNTKDQKELNQEEMEKANGGVATRIYRNGRFVHGPKHNVKIVPVPEEKKDENNDGVTGC